MSHIWMSHVTHMNESCHKQEWVILHTGMSHVTYIDESCHMYESLANMVNLVLEILQILSSQIDQSGLLEILCTYTYICRRTLTHAHTDTTKLCKSGQSHQDSFCIYLHIYSHPPTHTYTHSQTLQIWSIWSWKFLPGKIGLRPNNSARIQPILHMSSAFV